MSMLSSMCDELRKTADKVDEFGKTLWRGTDVLDDATREMRDAADTIWELRNDCVKLMDERNHWRVEQTHAFGNWEDAYKRAKELEDENAKLREIASLMAVHWLPNDVRMSPDEWHDRDELIRGKLRELEIEVDDETL